MRWKFLALACAVVGVEFFLRRFAPRSPAYAAWTRFFLGLGSLWTAVLLAIIYFASVSLVAVGVRLFGKDPLDRSLAPEPSFWRPHEKNPLEPDAAARHQF